jgi:hypothetical protein
MVTLDGLGLGTYAPTGWIVAYGQGDDDLIAVDRSITLPAELFAGRGDDILIGGGGRNILVGGSGDDTLIGGLGRNILIGGLGASTMVAGPSGDVLIGGTTVYDTNAVALRAISDEWSLGGSYLERYVALAEGRGLNHPYALNATTISASGRPDTLIGGGGQDQFYAQVPTDLVLNRAPDEIVVPIHPKKRRTTLPPERTPARSPQNETTGGTPDDVVDSIPGGLCPPGDDPGHRGPRTVLRRPTGPTAPRPPPDRVSWMFRERTAGGRRRQRRLPGQDRRHRDRRRRIDDGRHGPFTGATAGDERAASPRSPFTRPAR